MTVSPLCLVADGVGSFNPTANGVDVTMGATISVKLADTTDVSQWFLQVIGTDELSTAPVLTNVNVFTHEVTMPSSIVTFSMPNDRGRAILIRSTTAGTGGPISTTFAVYSLTVLATRVGAVGEKRETNATYGWTTILNPLIRTGAPVLIYDDSLVGPTTGATSIQEVIDWLKVNGGGGGLPFEISSFAAATTLVEVGASVVTPAFTAAYQSGPTTAASLTDTEATPAKDVQSTPTAFTSNATFTKNAYAGFVTFTLTATKGVNVDTANSTITWGQKVFWGVSATGAHNEAFIEALSNSALALTVARTFTVTAGANQHIYYAFRSGYGTPTFTVGGFEGGFELAAAAVSVTNANGFTENYDVWRSVQTNLGTTTVTVS